MKILKIELQNINSLKSDTPFVIDFESEQFKDVGLYAITGPTGAGKTTILDAITIALYHSVPRFNGAKGTLLDVVSHGANDAFSCVTFENNNFIYEGYWGVRLANKTGIRLKKPIEIVVLKNLTTEKIIADQKRKYIEEIEKVTQLDYTQFLRSVMLAQGEFASFLSAKGPEKGKLLEQITGEEIYKKIGQGILDRKSKEDNTLKEFESKINSEDVLSEEDKTLLIQKDKVLDVTIKKTEESIKSTQLIVDWYVHFQDLIDKSESLNRDANDLNIFIEKHKTELNYLQLNEKAEPFKELLQEYKRIEKEGFDKTNQLKNIEADLKQLKPEIENLSNHSKKQASAFEEADKEFRNWLPKFDVITSLDGELKNELDNKRKSKQKLEELIQQIGILKKEEENLTKEFTDTEIKIKSSEAFVSQNKFLEEVDSEISNWTRALTTLNAHKKTLNTDSEFIIQKNKEIKVTTSDVKENKELLHKKIEDTEKIEKKLSVISEELTENNLTDLLAKKERLSLSVATWKELKNLSEQTLKSEEEQAVLSAQKKSFLLDLETVKNKIIAIQKQIKIQEKSVVDADKILDLEKSIAKYETDRQNLIDGEPCGLCGSEEHPFTEHLKAIDVSKSELELNKRKKILNDLIDSKNKLDKKEVQLKTTINGLVLQFNAISEKLKTFMLAAEKLNMDFELVNLSKINKALNVATSQLKVFDEKIKVAQEFQEDKNKLSKSIEIHNTAVHALKTIIVRLQEKIKNSKTEVEIRQKNLDNLSLICIDLENDLTTKLAKFNYQLPTAVHTNLFIKELEELIADFNKKQKNLDALKANVAVIKTQFANNKKQRDTSKKTQSDYDKIIKDCDVKLEGLKTKRIGILPIDITVDSKRNSLQLLKNEWGEKVEISKKELQKRLDTKTEKEALKVENEKEQKHLIAEFSSLKTTLDSQIESSSFEAKQDIEKALLSTEDKLRFIKNKEEVKEKQLKIKTLKEANVTAKEALNKSKKFKISEAESKLALEDLTRKNKEYITEKGEIRQAFRKNQEIRDRNQEIYKKIDAQAEVCGVWKELFKIIGNSKDAFNVYVQRLTLKHLLDLANVHLYKLNKRYSLQMEESYKPKEELNFNLIDHYQTDQARLVDTSSGGEKFIISLALALGLSDLASKNVKIDSLFIDEGFGTLDNNTLETVISTLETLQSQGKMIGIISHVENLKERISTQIQITKKSNGVSVVAIV